MIASTDPVSDMLTRIRNAMMVQKTTVRVPYSKLKFTIATLLVEKGFLVSIEVDEEPKFKEIVVSIAAEGKNPKLTKLERVSKPGRRLYVKANDIPRVMNGRGIMIVSTSKGIMTDTEAREQKVGGELMCKVY